MHPTPNQLSQLHGSRDFNSFGLSNTTVWKPKKVGVYFQKHFRSPKDWEHILLKICYGHFHGLWVESVWVTCLLFPLVLCMFILRVHSTRYLSNCYDISSLTLQRKKSSSLLHHYHHCKDVWALRPWESGDLVSGPQPLTDGCCDYVTPYVLLCKTHAGSGRDFCLQCWPVLNRENKDEGRSMSGGSISPCMGGHYWGLGASNVKTWDGDFKNLRWRFKKLMWRCAVVVTCDCAEQQLL